MAFRALFASEIKGKCVIDSALPTDATRGIKALVLIVPGRNEAGLAGQCFARVTGP